MVTTLIAQIIRFARPNIQIYDARVVDLYQWVCAQYLRWCEACRNKGKAQLSSALDRISERIMQVFQTLSRPEAIRGSTIGIRNISIGYGGESGTPSPDAAITRKPPKNKDSNKGRSSFVTTAVYHPAGRFGRQCRAISGRLGFAPVDDSGAGSRRNIRPTGDATSCASVAR